MSLTKVLLIKMKIKMEDFMKKNKDVTIDEIDNIIEKTGRLSGIWKVKYGFV